jgi:hypothetical protein
MYVCVTAHKRQKVDFCVVRMKLCVWINRYVKLTFSRAVVILWKCNF